MFKYYVFYCAERDSATVYSETRIEDVSYGEIVIKDKKKKSKTKGRAAPLFLHLGSFLHPITELNANI